MTLIRVRITDRQFLIQTYAAVWGRHGLRATSYRTPDGLEQFYFLNEGKKLVRVTHHGETIFLEPGKFFVTTLNGYDNSDFPEVQALNNGTA